MILAQNIQKSYEGKLVVHPISFEVGEGKNLVLLGTSGSGKTTILKMINGLLKPDRGQIYINGKDSALTPGHLLRRSIGYVIQGAGLFPHLRVIDNIVAVPELLKWERSKQILRAKELLERLELSESLANKWPHQLSGGQQQRVGIARAIAANPPILLMDEPFGALDPITRRQVRDSFLALEELKKTTIVFVTHDVEEAFLLADNLMVLNHGRVQLQGAPTEVLFGESSGFAKEFLTGQKAALQMQLLTLADLALNEAMLGLQPTDHVKAASEFLLANQRLPDFRALMSAFAQKVVTLTEKHKQ